MQDFCPQSTLSMKADMRAESQGKLESGQSAAERLPLMTLLKSWDEESQEIHACLQGLRGSWTAQEMTGAKLAEEQTRQ